MSFDQRSYSGKTFRPRPIVDQEKMTGTWIVATSWGAPEKAQEVIDLVKEQLSFNASPDATRVGTYIPELSDSGNNLRNALLFANQKIYTGENSKEYSTAVEIALVSVQNKVLSWAQLGMPHILLQAKEGLQPLASQPDWSWQFQQESPLITRGLGMERVCYPNCGSSRVQGRERILFLSRSSIPGRLYSVDSASLSSCSEVLVEDHPEAPFWLGILDF